MLSRLFNKASPRSYRCNNLIHKITLPYPSTQHLIKVKVVIITLRQNKTIKQESSMNTTQTTHDLFLAYVDVCNDALAHDHDTFPFKYIIDAVQSKKTPAAKAIILNKQAFLCYDITLEQNKIYVTCSSPSTLPSTPEHLKWEVDTAYLQTVVGSPEQYIQNPAKLNWEWLENTAPTPCPGKETP